MKRTLSAVTVLILLCFLLFYPEEALYASRQGLKLWLFTLLPTLLPFLILSSILIGTDKTDTLLNPLGFLWKTLLGLSPAGAYAFCLGLLCGYPMGAKLTADLYRRGSINRQEACYLLTFSNNASPMFLTSFVVLECLGKKELLLPSYLILYTANFICCLCFRIYYRKSIWETHTCQSAVEKKETSSTPDLGTLTDASIMNGFETITRLGGYILLFSIFSAMVGHFWPFSAHSRYLVLGTLEISTGLHQFSASPVSFAEKFILTLSFTAFGGFCILAQTKSVLNESGLSIRPYFTAKCMNFIFTAVLALFFIQTI